jgi:hypothetical protein
VTSKQKKTRDDPEQSKAFIEKAKEIGADEKSRADDLMARLAKMKPEPRHQVRRGIDLGGILGRCGGRSNSLAFRHCRVRAVDHHHSHDLVGPIPSRWLTRTSQVYNSRN